MSTIDRGFIRPVTDDDGKPFWEGLARGELRVQRCAECGVRRFPPRPMCAACRCTDSRWEAVEPTGRIWSYIVVHPPVRPALADMTPFNVVVVELDVDPTIRLVGNVVNGDGALVDGRGLHVGEELELVVATVAPGVLLPRWRLNS